MTGCRCPHGYQPVSSLQTGRVILAPQCKPRLNQSFKSFSGSHPIHNTSQPQSRLVVFPLRLNQDEPRSLAYAHDPQFPRPIGPAVRLRQEKSLLSFKPGSHKPAHHQASSRRPTRKPLASRSRGAETPELHRQNLNWEPV